MQKTHSPAGPIAAVSALLVRNDEVLMVKRGRAPNAGLWSFPGGKIQAGERLEEAVLRELAEETGVEAEVRGLVRVLDVIAREAGQLQYHYLLVVMRCDWRAGEPWPPTMPPTPAGFRSPSCARAVIR
ncbi:NUDIX hydrolase [Marinobacterium aestuariivivens]|uniref:NUDIX hydrolase n=1 Tax=Marinobacterium aestuariivivens TaxID=1698799 RepID=A0ABW2A6J3_9GAMM